MNISSVSALRPSAGTAAYGAANAGVDSLTRSLAVEWGPKVRVNTVDVGLCRTEQTVDHYGGDATVRAIDDGRTRWVLLAGACVGFGFLAKMLQAFLVIPALGLVYLLFAHTSLLTRVGHLLVGLGTMVTAGGWWVAIVSLWPAGSRPYIGGSQDNSILELTLGYNGFGRLTGDETGSVGGGAGANGGSMWGEPGLGRLLGDEIGGQVGWLLPACPAEPAKNGPGSPATVLARASDRLAAVRTSCPRRPRARARNRSVSRLSSTSSSLSHRCGGWGPGAASGVGGAASSVAASGVTEGLSLHAASSTPKIQKKSRTRSRRNARWVASRHPQMAIGRMSASAAIPRSCMTRSATIAPGSPSTLRIDRLVA